jgi:hypothetical protein
MSRVAIFVWILFSELFLVSFVVRNFVVRCFDHLLLAFGIESGDVKKSEAFLFVCGELCSSWAGLTHFGLKIEKGIRFFTNKATLSVRSERSLSWTVHC